MLGNGAFINLNLINKNIQVTPFYVRIMNFIQTDSYYLGLWFGPPPISVGCICWNLPSEHHVYARFLLRLQNQWFVNSLFLL